MDATKSRIICWCGRVYQVLSEDGGDWDEQSTGDTYHTHTDREGPPPVALGPNTAFGVALATGSGEASTGSLLRILRVAVATGSGTAATSAAYLLNINIVLLGSKVWIKI